MPSFHTGLLDPSDIPALLDLQSDNMIDNLSRERSAAQGFLTFRYDTVFIQEMMKDMAQPVARDGAILAGYALATSVRAVRTNALTKPMAEICESLLIQGKPLNTLRCYMMGQICVREGYRGLGMFDALYAEHKTQFAASNDYLITEISQQNHRSIAAHARVGFQTVHTYNDGTTDWNVVAWDFR